MLSLPDYSNSDLDQRSRSSRTLIEWNFLYGLTILLKMLWRDQKKKEKRLLFLLMSTLVLSVMHQNFNNLLDLIIYT